MKKGTIAVIAVVASLVVIGLCTMIAGFSYRTTVIKLDNAVETQYVANKSTYDSMWKKFKEMAQVSDLQAEQVREIYLDLISGRYEDDQSLFKMITEDNPKLADTYTPIQQQIAADRNVFNNEQKKVIDKIGQYNVYINQHFIWNGFFGYQDKNIDEYVVTSDKTEDAFNERKDDEFKLK